MDKESGFLIAGDSLNFSSSKTMRNLEPDISGLAFSPKGEIVRASTANSPTLLPQSQPVFETSVSSQQEGSRNK